MAVDRTRLIRLLGGLATPAYQLYVPVDPQHDPALDRHAMYAYDPQKAAALLKASGYHGQPISLLYETNYATHISMAPGIQQDLQQIGLKVTLRGMQGSSMLAIGSGLSGHEFTLNSIFIDYPDAYDVYTLELACGVNVAGGTSYAHYCDPVADALAAKAQALPLGPRRDALMRQAQLRHLESATRVPLVYFKSYAMVSPRVGGFYYQPIFGWQFENYWLKP
jgi:ABC-type transport system substrate-binding protein